MTQLFPTKRRKILNVQKWIRQYASYVYISANVYIDWVKPSSTVQYCEVRYENKDFYLIFLSIFIM